MAVEGGYGAGSFSRLNAELEKTAVYFGAATGAARTLVSSLEAFSEFDRQLRLTNTVADGTAATFAKLRQAAIDFSTTTTSSATQAAQAMYFLASAGYTAQQSIQAMTGVLLLSQATMSDASKSADTLVSILNQYGLQASDASKVSDIMTAAINRSQATIEKMAYAMRQVGPVAAYMGQSFRETASWLSVLFNAGLRGEQAGTALRNILLRLAQPTQQAATIMRSLGVDVIDPLTLKFKGLASILEGFRGTGITAGVIKQLVGDEASAGFKILLRSVSDAQANAEEAQRRLASAKSRGAPASEIEELQKAANDARDSFQKMYDELDPDKHAATKTAIQNMQAFASQMAVARNQVTAFAYAVGETLANALSGPLRIIGQLGDGFSHLSIESQQYIGSATLEGAALLLLTSRWTGLGNAVRNFLGLGIPRQLQEINSALTRAPNAVQAAERGITQVAAGVAVPGVTPGLGGAGRRAQLLEEADHIATAITNSRYGMFAQGSAGFDFRSLRTTNNPIYFAGVGNRPGIDFPNYPFIPARSASLQNTLDETRAAGAARYAEAAARGGIFSRAATAIGGAAGGLVGALGGPGGAILTAVIAADSIKLLSDAIGAVITRNVVHDPRVDFTGFEKMAEMVQNLIRQGDTAGAFTQAAGNLKAASDALDVATKHAQELQHEVTTGHGPDIDAAMTSLRATLQQHGVSPADIDYILKNRTFTRTLDVSPMAQGMLGAEGVPAPPIEQRISGTEGLSEDFWRNQVDRSTQLKEALETEAKAKENLTKRTIEYNAAASRVTNAPSSQEVLAQPSQQAVERLVIPFELGRGRYRSLEQLAAGNRQAIRQARGTPEAQYQDQIDTSFQEMDAAFGQYLDSRVKQIQGKVPQLAQIDIATLLGEGNRPGTIDISQLNRQLAQSYGSPAAAQAHLPEIMQKLQEAINHNTEIVLHNQPLEKAEELRKVIEPEIKGMFSGTSLNVQTPTVQINAGRVVGAGGGDLLGGGGGTNVRAGDLQTVGGGGLLTIRPGTDVSSAANQLMAAAARYAAEQLGHHVEIISGYGATHGDAGSRHRRATAQDIQIYDVNGRPIPNEGADSSGFYRREYELERQYIERVAPSLAASYRYGGTFGTHQGGHVPDLMHRDFGNLSNEQVAAALQGVDLGVYSGGNSSAPGAIQSIYGRAAAREQGAFFQEQTQKRQEDLKIAQLQRDADVANANKLLSLAKEHKDDLEGIAKAQANLNNVTSTWEIKIRQIQDTMPEHSKKMQDAMAADLDTFRKEQIAKTKAANDVLFRDIPQKQETQRRQEELGLARAQSTLATAHETVALQRGDVAGLAGAYIDAEKAKTTLDYLKQIDDAQKAIVEYSDPHQHAQTKATQEYVAALKDVVTQLKLAKEGEIARLSSAEATAKATHDAAVAANEKFKKDNEYTGTYLDGIKYAAEKAKLEADTMFDLGARGYQLFSDRIGTAFTQLLAGKTKDAQNTVSKFLADLAAQIEKAALQKLILNPLMDSVFGTGGGTGGNSSSSSSTPTGTGSSATTASGATSWLGGLFGGAASKGIFGGITDWLGITSSKSAATADVSSSVIYGNYSTPLGDWSARPSAYGNVFDMGEVVPYAQGGVFHPFRRHLARHVRGSQRIQPNFHTSLFPFAYGGIVDRPTVFPMANGAGLMGEAGPEAIMPLRRTSSGALGVSVMGGGGHNIHYNPSFAINVGGGGGGQRGGGGNADPRHAQALVDQLHQATREAVINTLKDERRPGGSLYDAAAGTF